MYTEETQQVGMIESPECSPPQLDAGELSLAKIDGDNFCPFRGKRKRIIAC